MDITEITSRMKEANELMKKAARLLEAASKAVDDAQGFQSEEDEDQFADALADVDDSIGTLHTWMRENS